jgi:dihydrofolate reductase
LGKLIYSASASLDGYIADKDGKFDWAEPVTARLPASLRVCVALEDA